MEPILMDTDNAKYNEQIRLHSIYLGEYNAILAAYTALGIGDLTRDEFKKLVIDPAGLVFDKLTAGQPVVIGSLTLNRSKALEIMEKPAGYEELHGLIQQCKQTKRNFEWYLSLIDVVDGEIVLHQSVIDKETEASKVYAVTDDEIKTYEFLQEVITLAHAKFGNKHVSLGNLLLNTVACGPTSYNGEDWIYKVRARNIKNIFEPGNNLY